VAVVINPKAGRGRGVGLGLQLDAALRGAGHEPTIIDIGPGFDERLREAAAPGGAVIVAGGDGTLHHALPSLLGSPAPVYHFPLGTENLFAREFGMRASVPAVLAALAAGRTRLIDAGEAGVHGRARAFSLMVGLGPCAGVIRRLSAARNGPISHLSYVGPVLAELARPFIPTLTIEADGRRVVEARRGWAIVANMRQFAMRLDPAADADPADGHLDLIFLPCEGGMGALWWTLRARARRLAGGEGVVLTRAREVVVRGEHDSPAFQMDGEEGGSLDGPRRDDDRSAVDSQAGGRWGPSPHPGGRFEIGVRVRPGCLRVLMPAT
jgi:diacylglycerol kinase (ATP)